MKPGDPLSDDDVRILQGLREQYLARSEGGAPGPLEQGWIGPRELELYDATFGARIGWKWRPVLDELRLRGAEPPRGRVLDWGCGTGVAARAWIEAFGGEGCSVALYDRSPLAREFAAARLRERWPALEVTSLERAPTDAPDVLLVSHVLGELDEPAALELVELARRSRFVAWVEPGTRAVSRRLGAARDSLRADLGVIAPCPHGGPCGALAAGRENDWCHHFAPPAAEAFTTPGWARFSRALGIDLRSLSFAFVVLARGAQAPDDPRLVRILARPRVEKGRALLEACTSTGLRPLRLLERTDRALCRSLREPAASPRLWRVAEREGRIESVEPLAAEPAPRPAEPG